MLHDPHAFAASDTALAPTLADADTDTEADPVDGGCPPPPRARRGAGERLVDALRAVAPSAVLVAREETPWASITFSGSRHRFTLAFTGPDAIAEGEALIATLPDHEFTVPGRLVADATIVAASHAQLPTPSLEVVAEILLLDDN
ncbi:hypothetical protein [Novosphingobium lentum]|uniref:hypothetical protein n=1 Tax=Novosphingobium lentum TaxID=145287 RepID=UPI000AB91F4F|nr:hypothetical protein [Novosphingobium lentum]